MGPCVLAVSMAVGLQNRLQHVINCSAKLQASKGGRDQGNKRIKQEKYQAEQIYRACQIRDHATGLPHKPPVANTVMVKCFSSQNLCALNNVMQQALLGYQAVTHNHQ